MAHGFTLHSIVRKGKELPIGAVVPFSDKDYKDMEKLGAVRKPTDAELALFGLANPADADDDKSDAKGKGKGRGKSNAKSNAADAGENAAPETGSGEGATGENTASGEGEGASGDGESLV